METPPDDTVIWRYMQLERLLETIRRGELRLARLDTFRDPWEGRWPKSIADLYVGRPLSSKTEIIMVPERYRPMLFASCWHASDYESAALWHIYSATKGVAVRSTIGRLKAALANNPQPNFFIGKVEYLDFKSETPTNSGSLSVAFLKRKSFEHEKEVRVLVLDAKGTHRDDSWPLTCDISVLIEKIYVTPENHGAEVEEHLKQGLETLGFRHIPIHRSTLYDTSVY